LALDQCGGAAKPLRFPRKHLLMKPTSDLRVSRRPSRVHRKKPGRPLIIMPQPIPNLVRTGFPKGDANVPSGLRRKSARCAMVLAQVLPLAARRSKLRIAVIGAAQHGGETQKHRRRWQAWRERCAYIKAETEMQLL
jgi:hypothetical protein